MTDPRFWEWLWAMENEIRPLMPMVYHHVWDNFPAPKYNKKFYDSNDYIACISKVTYDIEKQQQPMLRLLMMSHMRLTLKFFNVLEDDDKRKELREKYFGSDDKFVIMWNNRNAKRKQTGTLIHWYDSFLKQLDEEGSRKVCSLHTDPNDPYGQDVNAILRDFELDKGQVLLSTEKVPPQNLAAMYNIADVTVNISDAEGFWAWNIRVFVMRYSNNCQHDRRSSRASYRWRELVWCWN